MIETLGTIATISGVILALVGGITLLVLAFRTDILWGLGCLFVPFVSLIFLILHWRVAKRPFFWELAGVGLVLVGAIMSGLHHRHTW